MFEAFAVSASGMEAQRLRMNTIASNLANVETTRSALGGAYRRKDVLFATNSAMFGDAFGGTGDSSAVGVKVVGIVNDPSPFKYAYEPGHPDADTSGYVAFPNVNAVEEMVNMISASRSYEANVTAFKASKDMAKMAIDISG
jgi:flagellar basal-body rod protein FlgC